MSAVAGRSGRTGRTSSALAGAKRSDGIDGLSSPYDTLITMRHNLSSQGSHVREGEVTNVELAELFRAHGLTCEAHDEWIVFPQKEMRAQARIFDPPVTETIQLDVRLEVWPGWLLVESFTGLGKDRAASRKSAGRNG
jgi:hypothetical protein